MDRHGRQICPMTFGVTRPARTELQRHFKWGPNQGFGRWEDLNTRFDFWLCLSALYTRPMNLSRAFADSAQRNLTKTALFWGDEEYSYADLSANSFDVSKRLIHEFG